MCSTLIFYLINKIKLARSLCKNRLECILLQYLKHFPVAYPAVSRRPDERSISIFIESLDVISAELLAVGCIRR